MYKSLKRWINLPATVKPCLGRTGTGSKKFGEPFNIKCYAEGKMEPITSKDGAEIISSTRLYIEAATPINELDSVIFEGTERSIIAVSTFYRSGIADLKVVYLQ